MYKKTFIPSITYVSSGKLFLLFNNFVRVFSRSELATR